MDSPDPSNKALSLVSTGSRVRPTDRVVEGEDEHVAATGMATPSMSFSAPQGHSTPKPTSLKQARGTPQPDAVSSTTKPPIKTKPKPRPAMNVTPAPASVKSLKLSVATPIRASSSVVAQAPDPVPAAKVSTPAGLRVEQPVASSSKVGEAGLLGAAVTPRAPKARDVTPAVASRSDRPAAGKENVRDPSGASAAFADGYDRPLLTSTLCLQHLRRRSRGPEACLPACDRIEGEVTSRPRECRSRRYVPDRGRDRAGDDADLSSPGPDSGRDRR